MAEILRMPRLSDTMEEGNIVAWLKKVGDKLEPGDVMAEVETDKATMELESYQEGYLLYIGIKEGPVPVDGLIAIIGDKGEDYKTILATEKEQAATPKKEEKPQEEKIVAPQPVTVSKPATAIAPSPATPSASSDGRLKASPLAKKLAADSRIDISMVSGTGEGGRITKKDIEFYLKNPRPVASSTKKKQDRINLTPPAGSVIGDVNVNQMRKVIARRLGESKFTAPHFYLTIEIDMGAAISARKGINMVSPTRVSFNDMVVRACALALRAHPAVNSSWMGEFIRYNENINIGVAVAVPDGLLVPVINNADQKSLASINQEVKILAGKAKDKKLAPDEMQGNTFTISNLGMFGIDEFTAIINPPDACILAVGGIISKPIISNGEIVPGNMMKVTLSCDHRVVDGASGAQFLQTIKSLLENPVSLALENI